MTAYNEPNALLSVCACVTTASCAQRIASTPHCSDKHVCFAAYYEGLQQLVLEGLAAGVAPVLSSVFLFAQQDGVPRQMVLHVVRLLSPSLKLAQIGKVVAEKLVWRAMASVDGVSDMAVRASTLGTCIPSYD